MIQRVQSIYLFLAAVCILLVFAFDIAIFTDAAGIESNLSLYKLLKANGEIGDVTFGMAPVIALSVTAALFLATIFMFKNRSLQIKLVRVGYGLIMVCVGLLWYFVDQNYWELEIPEIEFTYWISFFLPFAAFAFAMLANRGILADEKLVKSLDRLR
ncbi:MAG: DUF4293 domain-containing protein [Flavobacteriales bacterium]|nr:DUF4293 domain-containing protein [Flavobacteriales bacterium]